MAIRIGPDKAIAAKVKPSRKQPQAVRSTGGRSPATRQMEERRAREASDARRAADARDRAEAA